MGIDIFEMNGCLWQVKTVARNDQMLVDRNGRIRLATTDPVTRIVYISDALYGKKRNRVLIHELSHCVIFSYGLLYDIHKMVKPQFWADAEEWICNFISDYGMKIFSIAYSVMGEEAWKIMPDELSKILQR